MCCLVTAGKHVYNIRAIARQSPIITIEELVAAISCVGCAPRLYSGDPTPAEGVQLRDIPRTVTT
jgi:hypothetical protein